MLQDRASGADDPDMVDDEMVPEAPLSAPAANWARSDIRRPMLVQRAVLTLVIALTVIALPLGPNRFALAATIVVLQIASTYLVLRRARDSVDELGAFMAIEPLLIGLAGLICPPSYVGANMITLASLGANAPYLSPLWLRRRVPLTIAAAVIPAVFMSVSHAPTVIAIVTLMSLNILVNRTGVVLAAEDAVASATWDADHDALTDLANRRLLIDRLDRLEAETPMGVLLIDLNSFKAINDTLGHQVGDEVLRHVARCLVAAGPDLTPVRLGGDEFAIMIPGPADVAASTADAVLSVLREPFEAESNTLEIDASIGIAHTTSAEPHELLRFADIAMFSAKRSGGGAAWYCSDGDQIGTRRQQHIT